jgi:hypothetical protein
MRRASNTTPVVVLRFEGRPRAYLNRCLHVPTEMDWQPGEFLDSERRFSYRLRERRVRMASAGDVL